MKKSEKVYDILTPDRLAMVIWIFALALAGLCVVELCYGDDYGYRDNDRPNQYIQEAPRQQYNPMENRWETTKGKKELKYNPHNHDFSYQDPGATPTYNPFNHTWEYAK